MKRHNPYKHISEASPLVARWPVVVTVKGSAKTSIAFVHAMDRVNDPRN